MESKPVVLTSKPEIARRTKQPTKPEVSEKSNGDAATNGVHDTPAAKKRGAEEAGLEDDRVLKREKPTDSTTDGDDSAIVLDDVAGGGAIIIDDE